jgi:cyanophycin synthetase
VQAVVIENGAETILRDGLSYDRCEVGIVTDLDGSQALADYDITESDQMVKVLRTQVDVVLSEGTAVLNAGDPRVAGSRNTAVLARLVAWLIGLSGKHTGLACGDGLFLERRRVDARDSANWAAGHRLLVNRAVQAVVIENGAESILADGLAYDRCAVGIVTDLDGAEKLAAYDIHEPDQMVKVLRTQVDVVLSDGTAVLNAADARVAALAPLCDGAVILYASDPSAAALQPHQAAGGKSVVVRQDRVVLANGSSESFLPGLGRLTIWRATHAGVSLDSLLAAVAAAWAMNIPLGLIGAGAEAFEADLQAALASLQLSQALPSSSSSPDLQLA